MDENTCRTGEWMNGWKYMYERWMDENMRGERNENMIGEGWKNRRVYELMKIWQVNEWMDEWMKICEWMDG